ncbi:hypothetical protein BH24PSE2_BH24PSE2_18360 [soil metagenome]
MRLPVLALARLRRTHDGSCRRGICLPLLGNRCRARRGSRRNPLRLSRRLPPPGVPISRRNGLLDTPFGCVFCSRRWRGRRNRRRSHDSQKSRVVVVTRRIDAISRVKRASVIQAITHAVPAFVRSVTSVVGTMRVVTGGSIRPRHTPTDRKNCCAEHKTSSNLHDGSLRWQWNPEVFRFLCPIDWTRPHAVGSAGSAYGQPVDSQGRLPDTDRD